MAGFDDLLEESVARPCGWCGRNSWLRLVASGPGGASFYPSGGRTEERPLIAALYQCGGCQHASLLVYELLNAGRGYASLYFKGQFPGPRAGYNDLLPADVDADRVEAWNAYHGGLHRAAILMARSALQRGVRTLTTFRGSLNAELDKLVEEGVVTAQLRANADEVRLTGNDVAHPEELTEVTESDARDSLTFVDDFLDSAIAIPERQRQRKQARGES